MDKRGPGGPRYSRLGGRHYFYLIANPVNWLWMLFPMPIRWMSDEDARAFLAVQSNLVAIPPFRQERERMGHGTFVGIRSTQTGYDSSRDLSCSEATGGGGDTGRICT